MDDKPIVKNAVTCGVCGSPADRYENYFICQKNPNHIGDLMYGMFDDFTCEAVSLKVFLEQNRRADLREANLRGANLIGAKIKKSQIKTLIQSLSITIKD